MKFTIEVTTLLMDGKDGSHSVTIYNNEQELLDAHHLGRRWNDELKTSVKIALTPEQVKEILTEHDPYNNGCIGAGTIEVEVIDGVAKLLKPSTFSGG